MDHQCYTGDVRLVKELHGQNGMAGEGIYVCVECKRILKGWRRNGGMHSTTVFVYPESLLFPEDEACRYREDADRVLREVVH